MAAQTIPGDTVTASSWPTTEESTASSRTSRKWLPPPPEQRRRPAQASLVAVKTKLCHRYVSGRCSNSKCTFAHGEQELRLRPDLRRTKLCQQWMEQGLCRNGSDCTFAHGQAELQSTNDFFKTTLCPAWKSTARCDFGAACRHAHGQEELRLRPDRIPPPPQSRYTSRRGPPEPAAAAPPPPVSEFIPSPPTYPPPDNEAALPAFVSSASYSENDYLPRPAVFVRAKRAQRSKASSYDRWRGQRRPPPPPPPPIGTETLPRKKLLSNANVPPPPLQDNRPSEEPCEEDPVPPSKQVDRAAKANRRASMIELARRHSQEGQWPRNHSVTGSFLRRQHRQSVICIDRSEQKPAAVDAYPLAAMVSNLAKSPRQEVDGSRLGDEEHVITGVLLGDGTKVRRGLPVQEGFCAPTSMLAESQLYAARGFVLLPAGWFASAGLRAPAALTAWFLPPGIRYPVAYSKPVKSLNTAACLWPCSEWAESTKLSTDIPPPSDIYG